MKHNIEQSVQAVKNLLGIVQLQSEELERLRQQIKEQEEKHRQETKLHEEDANDMAEIIEQQQQEIVALKSLIHIPDNVSGVVEELIKTRLYVWESLKNEGLIGWQKTELQPTGKMWKDTPKQKGRTHKTR